ncbi:MAG: hypothetical protein GF344_08370, partial [Chitinivibrionales bacterium]|nr:hypothetical protein [Chitinivibrionales bacterium]MBD3356891.1 hypothetical protein [Chitinivibrionales bacterium]
MMKIRGLRYIVALFCLVPFLMRAEGIEKRGVIDSDEHWRAEKGPFVI